MIKSNNPKILLKMNRCLRNLFDYFEEVLHPASGWSANNTEKRKRKSQKSYEAALQPSPECFNVRGASKKTDKLRRNPAP